MADVKKPEAKKGENLVRVYADIPEPMARALKVEAAQKGIKIKTLFAEILQSRKVGK